MLKDIFILTVEGTKRALSDFLPYYQYYLIAVFLAVTAYLLFAAARAAVKDPVRVPAKRLRYGLYFLAGVFLLMCLGHRSFIIFSDERANLQQAMEYVRTGHAGLLLSDSIMPFFFGLVLKLGNLTLLKAIVFLLLALHFLLWKLVLEEVFEVGAVLAAATMFLCAPLCLSCFPDIVSYMSFGYVLSSLAAYLALKHSAKLAGDKVYGLLPLIALLAVTFRQECVVLFPFILMSLLLSGTDKKKILPLMLASVLALPMLYSLWQDETGMNAEPFDRNLVAACYASGRPVSQCYTPGISANRSYMLNILEVLLRQNISGDRIVDLAEETYNAPNPSLKNAYYNLKYRDLWLRWLTLAAFAAICLGLVFLKSRRLPLVLLAGLTGLYFTIFYLQKYSVGDFERFYFYLFPLYGCFLAVLFEAAMNKYRQLPHGTSVAGSRGNATPGK